MSLVINPAKKSVMLTHGDCPDGSACVAFAKALVPDVQVIFGIHKIINDQVMSAVSLVEEGGVLWIADIVCDKDFLNMICTALKNKNASLGIYEHHETRSWLQKYQPPVEMNVEIVFDNNRCGSKIFFDSYVEKHSLLTKYADFSKVINDRDLWLNQEIRGIQLAKLHQIYGDEKFIDRFLNNAKVIFTNDEKILLNFVYEQEKKRIDSALNRMKIKKDESGFNYGVVFESGDSSDLLNAAIEKFNLEYAIMLDLNKGKGSIRGKGNMDCAIYSQNRGGGGHKRASGFPIEFDRPVF
jgi:oligoribonuclease NrnB/cAMP/cGMP phosphodiesterase (DHH superfamily)